MGPRSPRAALLALAIAACGAPPDPKAPPLTPPAAEPEPAHTAARPSEARPAPRNPLVGPDGETASLAGARVKIVSPSGAEQLIEMAGLHPPPGDRSLVAISPTALLFLDDGTLLVGLGDGTVTALDGDRRRRWSMGVRGAIRGLAAAGEGLVAVTTQRGVVALVTGEGRLRWERQVTAERLGPPVIGPGGVVLAASQRGVFAVSRGGDMVFSHASPLLHHRECDKYGACKEEDVPALAIEGDEVVAGRGLRFRLDGPHPAVPGLEPTFPLTFRKVADGSVVAIVATGPRDVFALVKRPAPVSLMGHKYQDLHHDEFVSDRYDLVHIEGSRTTRHPVPQRAERSEVFLKGTRPDRAPLHIDGLIAGPDGIPWVLARRISFELTPSGDSYLGALVGAGQILELHRGAVREHSYLFHTFAEHPIHYSIAAASGASAPLLCFSATCSQPGTLASPHPAPGKVTAVRSIGDGYWLLTEKGDLYRTGHKDFERVSRPEGTTFRAIDGSSERDVWADHNQRYSVLHFDGARWEEVPMPLPVDPLNERGEAAERAGTTQWDRFRARAADDAWSGRMRWDGSRWSIVHGAPDANAALARTRDDVWLGDEFGLWHGTAPGPSALRLPPPSAPDEGVMPAPTPLPLAAPEARWAAQRMTVAVSGAKRAAPLSAGRNVSASPDGVLWMQTADGVVEVDAEGRGTVVRRGAMESFNRWAYPEAKGRGYIFDRDEARGPDKRDELQRIEGRRTTREEVQLDHHDTVAVHGDARGSTWVVGTSPAFGVTSIFYEEAAAARAVGLPAWEDFSPHALVRAADGKGFRPVLGLPAASWCDVAAAPDGGAWFAGGLNAGPAGEGILFHARGRLGSDATARYRAPASLLAVAAAGAGEAWAVGAAGLVVHVRGGAVTRYTLESGEWLRAVFAAGPDDVWIGGDGGTLIHYDGRAFHPVNHPLGARAAITGIASARGELWAVGPSGILRVTRPG